LASCGWSSYPFPIRYPSAALGGDSANATKANAEGLKKGGEAWKEAETAKGLDNFTAGSDKK